MALNKNKAADTSTNDQFENPDETEVLDAEGQTRTLTPAQRLQAAADARKEAESKASSAASANTQVATKAATQVAVHKPMENPFTPLVDAFPVKFNTLTQLMANQGNFIHKDTNKTLGDTIVLELLSTQKHWVMSPGGESNDEESLKFVKYSDDGINVQDEDLTMVEARDMAIAAGYEKAKISERLYLVGCLVSAGKHPDLEGQMVQIDLPPSSVAQWKRHELATAFAISKGKSTPDGQNIVKMECTVKSQNKLNWTEVLFSQFKG